MEVRSLRRPRLLLPVLVAAVLMAGPGRDVSAAAAFRVIVHPQVKGSEIPRAVLSAIFLKQALKWGDGRPVVPVDQSVQSAVRRVFSIDVLRQGIVEVQVYWQRKITAGQRPPLVKTSDQDVVAFVASTPGAIGYISTSTPVPDGVREVAVVD
jgi:ABC-type phosphate transport system substrate-binding protein